MAGEVPTYECIWQQGEDGEINLVYSVNGVAPDLSSGYAVRMDVRNDAGTNLFVFNSEDITSLPVGETSLDTTGDADNEAVLGPNGAIKISVPRAASLPGGPLGDSVNTALRYDVFLRNKTTNKQKKILKGSIIIEPSQTRWV